MGCLQSRQASGDYVFRSSNEFMICLGESGGVLSLEVFELLERMVSPFDGGSRKVEIGKRQFFDVSILIGVQDDCALGVGAGVRLVPDESRSLRIIGL